MAYEDTLKALLNQVWNLEAKYNKLHIENFDIRNLLAFTDIREAAIEFRTKLQREKIIGSGPSEPGLSQAVKIETLAEAGYYHEYILMREILGMTADQFEEMDFRKKKRIRRECLNSLGKFSKNENIATINQMLLDNLQERNRICTEREELNNKITALHAENDKFQKGWQKVKRAAYQKFVTEYNRLNGTDFQ